MGYVWSRGAERPWASGGVHGGYCYLLGARGGGRVGEGRSHVVCVHVVVVIGVHQARVCQLDNGRRRAQGLRLDVFPGDGGLLALTGSHKARFPRPAGMYDDGNMNLDEAPEGVVNITPRAGDMVIITESLTHGALAWRPADRMRRILVLRYHLQTQGQSGGIPEEVVARLSPETVELISPAGPTDVKDIVHRDVVELS